MTLAQIYEERQHKDISWQVLVAGQVLPNVKALRWRFSMGSVPTATVSIHGDLPSYVKLFAPIAIDIGWDGQRGRVFTGNVESPTRVPGQTDIECVGLSRKLEVPYKRNINVVFLGDANAIVNSLMAASGVTNYVVNLPAWSIGTVVVQDLEFQSYGEAVNKVAEVDGSPWYEMPSGQVRVERRDPIPGPTATQAYFTGQLTGVVSAKPVLIANPNAKPRIRNIQVRQHPRETRNHITILGAMVDTTGPSGEVNTDQVETACFGPSPYIPSPPTYQDFTLGNELIDYPAKAAQVCARHYGLKNRLPIDVSGEVDGDPRLFLGETIQIEDPDYTGTTSRWFLKGYSGQADERDFRSSLELTGGPAAGGTAQIEPFACFTWAQPKKLIQSVPAGTPCVPAGGKATIVTYDGGCSQDFDGEIVSYDWSGTACGGWTATGQIVTRAYDYATISSDTVTLTVTDDDGNTDSVTQTVITKPTEENPLGDDTSGGGGPLVVPTIYCAAGLHAQGSIDGAITFNDLTKAGGGVSGNYISVSGRILDDGGRTACFGTDAGEIMRTIDVCVTGSKVFQGGGRIEFVWCDVVNRDIWWACTNGGTIYRSGNDGLNWSTFYQFPDNYPLYRIATPLDGSLWLYGGNTVDPSSLVRYFPNKGTVGTIISIAITGDLLAAVQAAGAGFYVQEAASREYLDLGIIFNGGVAPVHWFTNNVFAPDPGWLAATGLGVGGGKALAPGYQGPGDLLAIIASTTTYSAYDGVAFAPGTNPTPSQGNHLFWEQGFDGVYIGAASGGIIKTIDHGDNWGYIRPLGALTWPAGDFGYMISFEAAPLSGAGRVYIINSVGGTEKFQQLNQNETAWLDMDGAPANSNDIYRLRYVGGGLMFYGDTADEGELYRSVDYGNSWAALVQPIAAYHIHDFDIAPGGRLWTIWEKDTGTSETRVYYSDDNGDTWVLSHTRTGFGVSKHNNISCHPTNDNYIVCGFAHGFRGVHITTDGGTSWATLQVGGTASNDTYAVWGSGDRIVIQIQFPPTYHLQTSDDFGASYVDRYAFGVTDFHEILKIGPPASSTIFALDSDGRMQKSVDNGNTWIDMNLPAIAGPEFEAMCYDILADTLFIIDGSGAEAWKLVAPTDKDGTEADPDGWIQLPDTFGSVFGNAAQVIFDIIV